MSCHSKFINFHSLHLLVCLLWQRLMVCKYYWSDHLFCVHLFPFIFHSFFFSFSFSSCLSFWFPYNNIYIKMRYLYKYTMCIVNTFCSFSSKFSGINKISLKLLSKCAIVSHFSAFIFQHIFLKLIRFLNFTLFGVRTILTLDVAHQKSTRTQLMTINHFKCANQSGDAV